MTSSRVGQALLVLFMMVSCAPQVFYQVQKATPIDGKVESGKIHFENEHLHLTYDFFSSGGSMSFTIYNKTNSYLELDLRRSFFIKNDYSQAYFQNRVFSSSSETVNSLGLSNTEVSSSENSNFSRSKAKRTTLKQGSSVSYQEMDNAIIPPHTYITITQFSAFDFYSDCDYPKFPRKKEINTLKFTQNNTPNTFSNLISYIVNDETMVFENAFYVSAVTNYPDHEFVVSSYEDECDDISRWPINIYRHSGPELMLIRYERGPR